MSFLGLIRDIGASGALDIMFMSILIYLGLVLLKKTKTAFVLRGIFIIGIVYLIARQFNMELTASVFQDFFAVILIAIIVIFQEELKRFFERIAAWSVIGDFRRKRVLKLTRKESEILTRALRDFAEERIGALIVVRGNDPIHRHLHGGTDLNGELSEEILKSLFDPHSVGHDGALILEKNQILQFSCHLPLSKDFKKLGKGGTRHAAALGLAELTDALCLLVSEERGTISVARNGEIEVINDPAHLTVLIEQFYQDLDPGAQVKPWQGFFRKNLREKILAVLVTFALWFFIVHESKMVSRSYQVPIELTYMTDGSILSSVSPQEVEVTFLGRRSSFYFMNSRQLQLSVEALNLPPGRHVQALTKSNLKYPEELTFERVIPNVIEINLIQSAPTQGTP